MRILSLLFKKLGMASGFDYAPVLDDDNKICALNRREAMGDDKRRAPLHELLQGVLNVFFALSI